jgi:AraC-like DNA-binding protein
MLREAIGRNLLQVDVEPVSDAPPTLDMTLRALPGLRMLACSGSPWRMRRGQDMIAKGDDGFGLVINLAGAFAVGHRGREVVTNPGDAVAITNGDPATLTYVAAHTQHIGVVVPRSALAPLVTDIEDTAGHLIPRNTEALRVLTSYLRVVQGELTLDTPELRYAAVTHIHDLIALVLGATRDAADVARARGVRAARVREVLEQIKCGFAEPSFSPAVVAARLRLSPRYVQDLLQETGVTFTERVLELRLQKARQMLTRPAGGRATIGEIAYACGFNELAYFTRCFRRRFGASPSQFRRGARAT